MNDTQGEVAAGAAGAVVGAAGGGAVGASVGIAALGTATAGTVPVAIAGALIVGQGAALAWRHRKAIKAAGSTAVVVAADSVGGHLCRIAKLLRRNRGADR